RVTALNAALARFRSLRDRTPIVRLLVLCVCGVLVISFVTLRTAAVTVFLSDGLIVVATCGMVLTLVLVLSRRSTPETVVTEHVQAWNTDDNQRRRLLWTSHRDALPMAALHSISPPWCISVDLVHTTSSLPARLRASASNGLFPPTPGLRDDGSDPYADALPLYLLSTADADASDANEGPHLAAVAGDAVGAGRTPDSAEPPPPPPAIEGSATATSSAVLARDSPPPYHHAAASPPGRTLGLGFDVHSGRL
ncbi:hypothetical protein HK405_001430, partial [Cladochytrium tenue]